MVLCALARRPYVPDSLAADQFAEDFVAMALADRIQEFLQRLTPLTRNCLLTELERLEICEGPVPGSAELLTKLRAEFRKDGSTQNRGSNASRQFFAPLEPVLVDGALALYVERGGRTLLSWTDDDALLLTAARALADAVHAGALGKLTVEKIDGTSVMGAGSPLGAALATAGFQLTPKGLRLRR